MFKVIRVSSQVLNSPLCDMNASPSMVCMASLERSAAFPYHMD